MSEFLKAQLRSLKEYTPGEQPRDMQYIKLNTNESPFPPSKTAIKLAQEEADINDLSKKVLACVDVNPYFNYKADAKVVMIDIYNEFTTKGSPQKLEEIKVVLN